MDKKQQHTIYMRQYRASLSEKEKMDKRKRDNEYKKNKRRTDADWLQKERERRRKYGKINRYRNKDKDRLVRVKYLKTYQERHNARLAVYREVLKGNIIRPTECETCFRTPEYLPDKRSKTKKRYPLRADHHKGYEKENWLNVKWICKDCDGKQLRSKQKLIQ